MIEDLVKFKIFRGNKHIATRTIYKDGSGSIEYHGEQPAPVNKNVQWKFAPIPKITDNSWFTEKEKKQS